MRVVGARRVVREVEIEDEAIRRAFSKVSSWRTPPHWSSCDWHAELRAVLHSSAAWASLDYDDTRGVPLRAHICASVCMYSNGVTSERHYLSNGLAFVQPVKA